ncbi:uncharacterized protein BN740_00088 [Clostridium sp. CAG:628]|jgi:uncharacterized membrane-anchored protein YitT (DUF2179 family)|nr:uncharacterized protein BN740_00088 [Clostridium sp. CAG:628]
MGKLNKKTLINGMLLILGCLLIALTFNIFCVPNKIVPGGLSGVGIIFDHLFEIKTSYVLLVGNLLLVTTGIICLGLKDTIPSIIGAVVYTLIMYLTECMNITINLSSVFLNVITVGVLFGVGCTMVYLSGCSLGGLDIIGVIFNKKFGLTLGTSLFIVNGTVLVIGTFIFGIEALLISLIIRYIESKIIDTFLTGISDSKILFINTDKIEEITKYIIEEIESGVSEIKVTSGFKKQKNTILMCVVPTEKYLLLKSQIIQMDNDAFITVMDSYEVYGGTNRYKLPLHDLRI